MSIPMRQRREIPSFLWFPNTKRPLGLINQGSTDHLHSNEGVARKGCRKAATVPSASLRSGADRRYNRDAAFAAPALSQSGLPFGGEGEEEGGLIGGDEVALGLG